MSRASSRRRSADSAVSCAVAVAKGGDRGLGGSVSRAFPRRTLGGLALLGALLLAAVSFGAVPAAASAEPMSACTGASGAVVAVDFGHWGGPVLRSCGGTPTTGYALLNQGGWATTGTQHDGPTFICRIGYAGWHGGTQYPTAKDDACVVTPPATAYWSSWYAAPGSNTWTYATSGPTAQHPAPGSVDLWTFGATSANGSQGRPAISPDTLRAHPAASGAGTPPRRATSGSAAKPPVKASHPASKQAATPRHTATPARTSASPTPAAPTTAPTTAPAATAAAQPTVQNADPAPAAHHSSGSLAPAAIAAAAVAVIAGAVALRVRHRRRTG
ncbi:hypothetical protein SAMN05216259_104237 [Actinacidiphila guanduensis]|uniref:Uncharacterized protein n=1 Tax=Actinacidiphila guanduensis TaxID=310781 RepID=A0A1H0BML5_9ACTN|nr:hypothetical protein SAMN05216259_104237 [Actinacidiphila guanduensis]